MANTYIDMHDTESEVPVRALNFFERIEIVKSNVFEINPNDKSELPEILKRPEIQELVSKHMDLTKDQLHNLYNFHDETYLRYKLDKSYKINEPIDDHIKNRDCKTDLEKLTYPLITSLCVKQLDSSLNRLRDIANCDLISKHIAASAFLDIVAHDGAAMAIDIVRFEVELAIKNGLLKADPNTNFMAHIIDLVTKDEYIEYIRVKYPIFVRRLKQRIQLIDEAFSRLLNSIKTDRTLLSRHFSISENELIVEHISRRQGDSHNGGQSVTIIQFTGNHKIVYKPRSLSPEVAFQKYLQWINKICPELDLKIIRCYDQGKYGWMEFVEKTPVYSLEEVRKYFYRFGGLVASYSLILGTDLHYENLIANSSQPILVDLETIFHPTHLMHEKEEDPHGIMDMEFYANSVYFTGMIGPLGYGRTKQGGSAICGSVKSDSKILNPIFSDGKLEFKPIGYEYFDAHCLYFNSHEVNPYEYYREILDGFRSCYLSLLAHREYFINSIVDTIFKHINIRIVFKATRRYSKLLKVLNSSYAQEGYLQQDEYLQKLWLAGVNKPVLGKLVQSEIQDIYNYDIPFFTTVADSKDVYDARSQKISNVLFRTGVEAVKERACLMSNGALEVDSLCLENALKEKRYSNIETKEKENEESYYFTSDVDDLYQKINSELLYENGRLIFVDLDYCRDVKTVRHLPLNNDVYTGLPGICFSLAYYGAITGNDEITLKARSLSKHFFSILDLENHDYRVGVCHGIGGWVWLAVHLAHIWKNDYYEEIATTLAARLSKVHWMDRHYDIFSGSAGAILAVSSLYKITRKQIHLDLLAQLSSHLLKYSYAPSDNTLGWQSSIPSNGPTTGFAHGVSGIAYALMRAYVYLDDPLLLDSAIKAHNFLNQCYAEKTGNWNEDWEASPGNMEVWCHGAPGIALYYDLLEMETQEVAHREALNAAIRKTAETTIYENDSLCHGTLGNADIFINLLNQQRRPEHHEISSLHVKEVMNALKESGRIRCGTPYHHYSLSLFKGFSGMGYQLLRMKYLHKPLPSILTFDEPYHVD